MKVLQTFSEKEKAYHLYQARVNYVREQRTLEAEREKDLMLRKQAEAWAQSESARAEKAEVEAKQAKALIHNPFKFYLKPLRDLPQVNVMVLTVYVTCFLTPFIETDQQTFK